MFGQDYATWTDWFQHWFPIAMIGIAALTYLWNRSCDSKKVRELQKYSDTTVAGFMDENRELRDELYALKESYTHTTEEAIIDLVVHLAPTARKDEASSKLIDALSKALDDIPRGLLDRVSRP